MIRRALVFFGFVISFNVQAFKVPNSSSEVEFKKYEEGLSFKNIPLIEKTFREAKNKQERDDVKKECQDWVMAQLNSVPAPYFKVWCSYEVDVPLRRYNMRGHLLIKNW